MIKGLKIKENFLTIQEEQKLLQELPKSERKGRTKYRNTVVRYGSKKPYNGNIKSPVIPDYLEEVIERLVSENILMCRADSVTINEYFEGQELKYHIDTPESGDVITILSLLGDATLVFRKDDNKYVLRAPRRSVIQLSDDIRWKWEHYVEPLRERRYSLVFRCSS